MPCPRLDEPFVELARPHCYKFLIKLLFKLCSAVAQNFAIRMACTGQRSQVNLVKLCQTISNHVKPYETFRWVFRLQFSLTILRGKDGISCHATSNAAVPVEERLPLLPFVSRKVGKILPSFAIGESWIKSNQVNQGKHTHTHNVLIDISARLRTHTHTDFPWMDTLTHTHTRHM